MWGASLQSPALRELRGWGAAPEQGQQGRGLSPQVFPAPRPPFPGAQPRAEEVSKDLLAMLHFSRSQQWKCGQTLGVS